MASGKELRTKIKSVENTNKIISIALVIFLVFSTDLILVRSSLPDAIRGSF